jgi:hypothetical protein
LRNSASRIAGLSAGVLLALGLAGCGTPAEYRHPGEIPEGPGMLTGEDGVARLSTDGEEAGGSGTEAPDTDACACPEGDELEAYREFLRWKAEAVGTPEYREFQDWREWRRQESD